MEPTTAAMIAKAAIAVGTNKKVWTGIASVIAALCLPFILIIVCILSIASGGADHNRSAVRLAFEGGNIPSGMPADYREYIGQMQESFGELDTVLGEIDSMTEGELTDRYLVKAVFYSLYFGADRVRLDASDYQRFAECFVNYEERTRTIENPDGSESEETYVVAVAVTDKVFIVKREWLYFEKAKEKMSIVKECIETAENYELMLVWEEKRRIMQAIEKEFRCYGRFSYNELMKLII